MKVVVIGGVAAGPRSACRIVRLIPGAKVVMLDRGEVPSYAACGLPYYIGKGKPEDPVAMQSAPVPGVVRNVPWFQKAKNVEVRMRHEVLSIDRDSKCVTVKNLLTDEEYVENYDKLVIATGATPFTPPIPGIESSHIFRLQTIAQATAIKERLQSKPAQHAVVVGAGLIGMEMVEAFKSYDCKVTVVEALPHILNMLDPNMSMLVENYVRSEGVDLKLNTRVQAFEHKEDGLTVQTSAGPIECDFALVSIGVRPNTQLASAAGLDVSRNGIIVDDQMRTSGEDIFAAGDCVASTCRVRNIEVFRPLGSTANAQGRVLAGALAGFDEHFPGVLSTAICQVMKWTVARTGLTVQEAIDAGLKPVVGFATGPDRPHFMPGMGPLFIKLIVDETSRTVIGCQTVGPTRTGAMMITSAVTAISAGMTVDELSVTDQPYAPPYAPPQNRLLVACHIVMNKLAGQIQTISNVDVKARLDAGEDLFLLDVRMPVEYEMFRIPGSTLIPLGALRGKLDRIPRDKQVIVFCKISLRGYQAQVFLREAGIDCLVMDGGALSWPYRKEKGPIQ